MLVEIKPGINVPQEKEVVAFDKEGNTKTGILYKYFNQSWGCIDDQGISLREVTHFVTIENLLKTR